MTIETANLPAQAGEALAKEQTEANKKKLLEQLSTEELLRPSCRLSERLGRSFLGRAEYDSEKELDAGLEEAKRALPETPSPKAAARLPNSLRVICGMSFADSTTARRGSALELEEILIRQKVAFARKPEARFLEFGGHLLFAQFHRGGRTDWQIFLIEIDVDDAASGVERGL